MKAFILVKTTSVRSENDDSLGPADYSKDLATARKLLGDDKIIGVTASSRLEVVTAAKGGADYLGLGTVFATAT